MTVELNTTEPVEQVAGEIASWLSDRYKTEVAVYGAIIVKSGREYGLEKVRDENP